MLLLLVVAVAAVAVLGALHSGPDIAI